MNQLEERLRAAGRSHTAITPDIVSIRNRGLKIRRNRQIGTSLAAVVLVAVGGVAAFTAFRPEGDTTILSASEGELDDAADLDTTVPTADGESTDGTDSAVDPDTTDESSVDEDDETAPAVTGEGDDTADDDLTDEDDTGLSQPSQSSVSDGTGGWLTVTPAGIEHLRADGSSGVITFAEPSGGFVQRWPTDVVQLDGGHYLLLDQFLNREDLAADRERALAESYGVPYDAETGATGLEGVATPAELDSLNHWEVSILAVDLATDEIITVEQRVIHSTHSPEWVYNGHMTSDGSNLIVMRELWQGHCLYAEGLTLNGEPVDIADARVYAKPQGMESMTFEEIDAVFSMQVDPPQPCRTLAELPDSGLGVWGTQADPQQIEAFRTAFFETGLG